MVWCKEVEIILWHLNLVASLPMCIILFAQQCWIYIIKSNVLNRVYSVHSLWCWDDICTPYFAPKWLFSWLWNLKNEWHNYHKNDTSIILSFNHILVQWFIAPLINSFLAKKNVQIKCFHQKMQSNVEIWIGIAILRKDGNLSHDTWYQCNNVMKLKILVHNDKNEQRTFKA